MSLKDLQRASYKSPSGITVEFDYEDIESVVEKKTSIFENSIGNGSYIQSNGHTSGRFPMRCFFSGFGYDDVANTFLLALLEDGEGVLTHPIHDDIHVVPFGAITRSDHLKSGGKQVVYDVEFYETTGLQITEAEGLDQAFDDLQNIGAMDFTDGVFLVDATSKSAFRSRVEAATKNVFLTMEKASGSIEAVQNKIEDVADSIHRGMDTLLGDPLSLARQMQILVSEPRRQSGLSRAKIQSYNDLATNIFSGSLAEPSKYAHDAINTFHMNRMLSQSILANMGMAMVESTEFITKGDYIEAAESLMAMLDAYQTWQDANFDSIEPDTLEMSQIDIGFGLNALTGLLSSIVSYLFSKAVHAKTERREPLSSSRTPLDLCFELYGTTKFSVLDRFIHDNQLAGNELILLPKGREIVWYL